MDWAWDSSSHKKTQVGKAGITKIKDEWVWQPVKLGPGAQGYGSHQIGEILEDEVYPCGFCNGTGEKPKGSKCSVCKGKALVSVDPPAVRCAYCKGRGEERPRTNVTCTACRGKGIIHVEEPIELCSHCRGTGKEPTNKLVCIACRGKGVVTVKEEDKELSEPEEEIEEIGTFVAGKPQPKVKEEPVRSASGSEREALQVVKELGQADRVAVARNMSPPVSSSYAEMLCNALAKKRLLIRDGILYNLTPNGENALSGNR